MTGVICPNALFHSSINCSATKVSLQTARVQRGLVERESPARGEVEADSRHAQGQDHLRGVAAESIPSLW